MRFFGFIFFLFALFTFFVDCTSSSKKLPNKNINSEQIKSKNGIDDPFFIEIQKGWNGFSWGSSIEEFKNTFPDYKQYGNDRFCLSGEGTVTFCCCTMLPYYGFNSQWQFYQVILLPEYEDDNKHEDRIIETLQLDPQSTSIWEYGKIELELNSFFGIILITNRNYE